MSDFRPHRSRRSRNHYGEGERPERAGFFVGISAEELFATIPLQDAEPEASSAIRIEPGSNDELPEAFEDAVERSTRLFRNGNADRDLDDEEAYPARPLARSPARPLARSRSRLAGGVQA